MATVRKTALATLAMGMIYPFAVAFSAPAQPAPASPAAYVAGELLVKFKSNAKAADRSRLHTKYVKARRTFIRLKTEHWKLPDTVTVEEAIRELRASGTVEYAEPNYRRYPRQTPNDPHFADQWGLQNTGQAIIDPTQGIVYGKPQADMDLVRAWDISTGSTNVIIAVIDDSVDIHHPDLAANLWVNTAEKPGNSQDDDGNGYIDDIHGWDFVNHDNDPSADAGTGENHGTAVAGSAAAVGNNGVGVAGVAWTAQIMALKFGFDVASTLQAVQYAIDKGAHIINASWGGPYYSQAEFDAYTELEQAGILLIAAAGNFSYNVDLAPDYPGSYPHANILNVAATNPLDELGSFSEYGPLTVDVAAPGQSIYVTASSTTTGVDYEYTTGTSFSAPYVAGVALLLKADNPNATYRELKSRIISGVDALAGVQQRVAAGGRVNAYSSLLTLPAPALVISELALTDASGNGNSLLDPGETVDLAVNLENIWQGATGVSATLSVDDPEVTVVNPTADYPDIASGASKSPLTPFKLSLAGSAAGHNYLTLRLDITADGGYSATRYYPLEVGTLVNGATYREGIRNTEQDQLHLYHVDVPMGASNLQITTESASDVDLVIRPGGYQPLNMDCYYLGCFDSQTLFRAGPSGNETIRIAAPQPGTYHVTVVGAFVSSPDSYTIRAQYGLTPRGGGGGSTDLLVLLGTILLGLRRLRKR